MRLRSVCATGALALLFTLPLPALADGEAPLTLRRAIDAALAANPELQAFVFELRAQDARIAQARLRPPTFAGFDVENVAGTGANQGTRAAEVTLSLSQVVELGGKREARVASASAGRELIEIQRQAQQLDVLAEVTRRYIAVTARQEQVALAGEAVALARATRSGAQRRVEAAKSPHTELDRASIALERARLEARHADTQLEIARRSLAAMWGETLPVLGGQPLGHATADLYALPRVADFADLASRLERNPDFLRLASEARLREAELRLATTLRKPDIGLSLGLRDQQEPEMRGLSLVASFSVPLFSAGRATGAIDEARARRESVEVRRRSLAVQARATLFALHGELQVTLQEAVALRDTLLPRATEALRETQYAYERGRYGYLELVDAQRELMGLRAALIEACRNAQELRVEIERLTGEPLPEGGSPREDVP